LFADLRQSKVIDVRLENIERRKIANVHFVLHRATIMKEARIQSVLIWVELKQWVK